LDVETKTRDPEDVKAAVLVMIIIIIIIIRALNDDEDDVATLDFSRRILPFVDHTQKEPPNCQRKTKKRTQRKGTKINQKSSTIFTSTN
tara:strand:- start:121 stop:387 length:267 start_codon:yes stop_codon:yes gene_type:complete